MRQTGRILLSLVLSVGLGWYVWHHVDEERLLSVLGHVRWPWLLAAFGAFLIYQGFRTARMKILVDDRSPMGGLFVTLCLQATLNKLLPVWLGEAALVYLLHKLHDVGLHRSAVSVFLARLVDLALFVAAFVGAVVLLGGALPVEVVVVMLVVAAIVVALTAAVAGLWWWNSRWASATIGNGKGHLSGWLRRHLQLLLDALGSVSGGRTLASLVVYSALMWGVMYLFFVLNIRALGFAVDAVDVFWLYLLLITVNLLPVKGIADVGTHEAAWFISLRILGVGSEDAAILAFGSHVLVFLSVGLTLLIAAAGFSWRWLSAAGEATRD